MTLYPHQIEACHKALPILIENKLVYLSMEVRTGKTLTSLSIASAFIGVTKGSYFTGRVAFITKKKAIPSIEADYRVGNFTYKLICLNYESIHKVEDPDFVDVWILDEAHCLGQYPKPGQRTKDIKGIINGKPVILLSGTPTPESYSQIFHQLWVTGNSPFYHKKFYDWAKEFVDIKQKKIGGHMINDYSRARKTEIDHYIGHLFVTCSQSNAGFENVVDESVITTSSNEVSKFIFQKIEKDQVLEYSGRTFVADTPANMLNKMSQIAGGTLIDDEGSPFTFDDSKCRYILNNYAGKRIAIYYRYKAEYELLSSFFPKHTLDWKEFEALKSDVFMSQIQSGREGISLRSADLIVMYNIDFSATSYWQVRARMQYAGRVGACPIHWLFSDLGIEAKIYQAVSKKKNFTTSYYIKYAREAGTSKSQKKVGGQRVDGSEDHNLFSTGMAGHSSTQGRQNPVRGVQGAGQETNPITKPPARKVTCDWL